MNKYDSIIFDLDGTLWTACRASAIGWTNGLKSLGVDRTVTTEEIESVTGKPFKGCLEAVLSDVDMPIETLVEVLNEHEIQAVKDVGGEIYEGVLDLIPELGKTHKLFIVSNCQEWYLNLFFEKSGLKGSFSDWDCHGRLKRSKADNIIDVVKRNNLRKPVYVGDTVIDQEASKNAGVDFIHARYGFGDIGAPKSIDSFKELASSRTPQAL